MLNKYIDHTLLKQGCTEEQIQELCDEAIKYNFAAVCIPPHHVSFAAAYLKNKKPKVCTVIGFPFAYTTIEAMKEEIKKALKDGVEEIDIVQNVSLVKQGEWDLLHKNMKSLIDIVTNTPPVNNTYPIVKIILETGLLTNDEIKKCCETYITLLNYTDFIKTSTGFAKEISDVEEFKKKKIEAVSIIQEAVNGLVYIKASGGIRDIEFASELIKAGASRLGCSSGVSLMENTIVKEIDY